MERFVLKKNWVTSFPNIVLGCLLDRLTQQLKHDEENFEIVQYIKEMKCTC